MALERPWDVLLNYEAHDFARYWYGKVHNLNPGGGHTNQITSAFRQGRAYFASAENADRIVKPLLLFYGVLSLARGTILFLNRSAREATLSPKHGLSEKNWQNVFGQSANVGAFPVETRVEGTLSEFASATKNCTLVRRPGTGTLECVFDCGELQEPQQLVLQDLLSRFPELQNQCSRWLGAVNCRQRASALSDTADHYVWDDADHQEQAFFANARLYDIQPFPNGFRLSKAVATYIVAYALSMLVRYFPSCWTGLSGSHKGDAAMPTLLGAVSFIERRFPEMIADHLEYRRAPEAQEA